MEIPEGGREQSWRKCRMILPQDAVNIVSRIRGDQNVGNRESNYQGQRDSRPLQCGAAPVASNFVSVRQCDGRRSTFPAVGARGLTRHDFSHETSLATARIWLHRLAVRAGPYRLNYGYVHTVDVAWEQSLEGRSLPSGKLRNDSFQSETIGEFNPLTLGKAEYRVGSVRRVWEMLRVTGG
jgi:hypothetical protein